MKRILTTLIASTILCASLCACGEPASSPVEDFTYEFEDGTVTITGYTGSDLEIVIPSVIEERPVTVIGEEAFEGYDMTSVIIAKSVIELEKNAFNHCECLESITVPDTLQTVGYNAFNGTAWMNNQPEGVLYLGNVVVGYKGIAPESITIKDGTTSIVDEALLQYAPDSGYKGDFSSIHIPESVVYIGEYVGYYHSSTNIVIDDFTIYGKSGSTAETYAKKIHESPNTIVDKPFNFIAE